MYTNNNKMKSEAVSFLLTAMLATMLMFRASYLMVRPWSQPLEDIVEQGKEFYARNPTEFVDGLESGEYAKLKASFVLIRKYECAQYYHEALRTALYAFSVPTYREILSGCMVHQGKERYDQMMEEFNAIIYL